MTRITIAHYMLSPLNEPTHESFKQSLKTGILTISHRDKEQFGRVKSRGLFYSEDLEPFGWHIQPLSEVDTRHNCSLQATE